MPDHCPECGLFMPEPVYYGAMYVSYALTIAPLFLILSGFICFGVCCRTLSSSQRVADSVDANFFRYGRSYYLALIYKIENAANKRKKL